MAIGKFSSSGIWFDSISQSTVELCSFLRFSSIIAFRLFHLFYNSAGLSVLINNLTINPFTNQSFEYLSLNYENHYFSDQGTYKWWQKYYQVMEHSSHLFALKYSQIHALSLLGIDQLFKNSCARIWKINPFKVCNWCRSCLLRV